MKVPLWQADTITHGRPGRRSPRSGRWSSDAGSTRPAVGAQEEAALLAVAGDEDEAGLAACRAQGAVDSVGAVASWRAALP